MEGSTLSEILPAVSSDTGGDLLPAVPRAWRGFAFLAQLRPGTVASSVAAMADTYGGTSGNASTISYSTGIVLDTSAGKAPERTPKELIATRAIQAKDGWLGQITMAGEIVYETAPQETSQDALEHVNRRIHKAFKRLIVGKATP